MTKTWHNGICSLHPHWWYILVQYIIRHAMNISANKSIVLLTSQWFDVLTTVDSPVNVCFVIKRIHPQEPLDVHLGPFYKHGLTLIIPTWVSNLIIHPFPNISCCTIEVWEWMRYFIPCFLMDVGTHPCWDRSQSMLVNGVIVVINWLDTQLRVIVGFRSYIILYQMTCEFVCRFVFC